MNNKALYEEIKNEASQIQFNEIEKHIFNEIKSDENLTQIKKEYLKDINNNELCYYNNFEIISNYLYQVLDKMNISLNDEKMIKTKCLFEENKIIFYPNESNANYLIISSMNIYNEFCCDFIFYYNNSIDLKIHIKEIQKNGLENTISNLNFINNLANLYNDISNKLIGKAYKIREEKSDKDLPKEIKEEIFTIIKIFLFNRDLKMNVDISMKMANSKNYEKYIYKDKCYLINKEWMYQYQKYYLYDELFNYLEKKEIKERLEIHHYKKN